MNINAAHIVFIATGSNLGDRKLNLDNAAKKIEEQVGSIVLKSHIYQTEPWGHKNQPDFYNQALKVATALLPGEAMKQILQIENEMGRVRTFKNASRIIDIDILFYDNLMIRNNGLTIPHPEIFRRKFVLEPLKEIAPRLQHPQNGKTIENILFECADPLHVARIDD